MMWFRGIELGGASLLKTSENLPKNTLQNSIKIIWWSIRWCHALIQNWWVDSLQVTGGLQAFFLAPTLFFKSIILQHIEISIFLINNNEGISVFFFFFKGALSGLVLNFQGPTLCWSWIAVDPFKHGFSFVTMSTFTHVYSLLSPVGISVCNLCFRRWWELGKKKLGTGLLYSIYTIKECIPEI